MKNQTTNEVTLVKELRFFDIHNATYWTNYKLLLKNVFEILKKNI